MSETQVQTTEKIKLSQTFLNSINERLSTFGFSSEDFIITQGNSDNDKNDNIYIHIEYRYNNYTHLTILKDTLEIFVMSYSPGKYLKEENKSVKTVEEYLTSIEKWIEILRIELKSSPLGRQIVENEEKIKEIQNLIEEKFKKDNTLFFSKEEGNALKKQLDELEKLFNEKIGDLKKESEQLHQEVEMLKEQVSYLPKTKWGTALAIKFINWTSRNPEAAKQIGQTGLKMLLPQEIEESISSILPEPQNKK